jgi:hypothetical protein
MYKVHLGMQPHGDQLWKSKEPSLGSIPLFLGVGLGRTLSGKEQADRKAANLSKGSQVLMALSGTDWVWNGNLLQKVYQTSLLSGATYAGGRWLPWLSATSVDMLDRAQNRNLKVITG